jgi:hypothetical protein
LEQRFPVLVYCTKNHLATLNGRETVFELMAMCA